MRERLGVFIACIVLLAANCTRVGERRLAEWTIMVYLNGDNTLQWYAGKDFDELAKIGSTQEVNVIVQFDRQGSDTTGPEWSQTLRFRVNQNMTAKPENAYADLGEKDMASGATVADFVRSTRNAFPARRYALILWGHGSGPKYNVMPQSNRAGCELPLPSGITELSYKGGTNDKTSHTVLYMRDLAESLKSTLNGERLDLFFFDECLMGMTENAYALREVADVMVASEELVPDDGLDNTLWLGKLVSHPQTSPRVLGEIIVESYAQSWSDRFRCLTLAAIDLTKVKQLTAAVSHLSDLLTTSLPAHRESIKRARMDCNVYGGGSLSFGTAFYHVDLQRFCELLASRSSGATRDAAIDVISALHSVVIHSAAGGDTVREKGSHGLAIYFPPDGKSYCEDDLNKCGYEERNKKFPLEFVVDERWDNFLHAYFDAVPDKDNPNAPQITACRSANLDCEP